MNPQTQLTRPPRSVRPIADVALELVGPKGRVWYGNPQLCHDIYDQSGHTKAKHPLNVIASVVSALGRSEKWVCDGYITHLGRQYPAYIPRSRKARSVPKRNEVL